MSNQGVWRLLLLGIPAWDPIRLFGDCSLNLCLHCVQCRHKFGDMRSGPKKYTYTYTHILLYLYIHLNVHNMLSWNLHLSMSRCIHIWNYIYMHVHAGVFLKSLFLNQILASIVLLKAWKLPRLANVALVVQGWFFCHRALLVLSLQCCGFLFIAARMFIAHVWAAVWPTMSPGEKDPKRLTLRMRDL